MHRKNGRRDEIIYKHKKGGTKTAKLLVKLYKKGMGLMLYQFWNELQKK